MTTSEFNDLLRKNHFCIHCKKQDAYTLAGRSLCYKCAELNRTGMQRRMQVPAKKEQILQYRKERYQRLVAEHRCTTCRKPLESDYQFRDCVSCRVARSNRQVERKRAMTRYIDAEALKQDLIKRGLFPAIVKRAVEEAPTVDVARETIKEVRIKVAMHFGTYTAHDTIRVHDVFMMLERIEQEMLEE